MVRFLAGCGKSISVQQGFKDLHVQEKKITLPDSQKGRPARPGTKLVDFSSIRYLV
jgi:hypothetical protein